MFITLINDCKSPNDIGRLSTRYSLLFPGVVVNFVGVDSSLGINSTLEAAGNLIDILDAGGGNPGIVAVNVAPRGQISEDGPNGSSFCYFYYKNTLIVSTIKGYNLSLIKKLKLQSHVAVLDTQKVVDFAKGEKLINKTTAEHINNTQFRSYEYQPRVCRWLWDGIVLPNNTSPVKNFIDCPNTIWHIDAFGNAKTTLLPSDIAHHKNSPNVKTNFGNLNYYDRLRLVPSGETAIYVGSSGIEGNRFLEIATQNKTGSAAQTLKLKVGDIINILYN